MRNSFLEKGEETAAFSRLFTNTQDEDDSKTKERKRNWKKLAIPWLGTITIRMTRWQMDVEIHLRRSYVTEKYEKCHVAAPRDVTWNYGGGGELQCTFITLLKMYRSSFFFRLVMMKMRPVGFWFMGGDGERAKWSQMEMSKRHGKGYNWLGSNSFRNYSETLARQSRILETSQVLVPLD